MDLGFFTMPIHPKDRNYAETLAEDRECTLLAEELGFKEKAQLAPTGKRDLYAQELVDRFHAGDEEAAQLLADHNLNPTVMAALEADTEGQDSRLTGEVAGKMRSA